MGRITPNRRTGDDMTSTEDHYENLLAPVYLWMAGGMDSALAQGTRDVADFLPDGSANPVAIDLGAGFGMHAIPLARNGYAVTAIDTSDTLLAQLKRHSQELNIQAINADIRDFRRHATDQADLIVCMTWVRAWWITDPKAMPTAASGARRRSGESVSARW